MNWTDAGYHERKKFILSRDAWGRAKYVVRRFYHEKYLHLAVLALIYCGVSTLQYREELAHEREQSAAKIAAAEYRAKSAEEYSRAEPIYFVVPANDVQEYRLRMRDIRNAANDQIEHGKAARIAK